MTLKEIYDSNKDVRDSQIPTEWKESFNKFIMGQACYKENEEYVYYSHDFRQWYHINSKQIERDTKINDIIKFKKYLEVVRLQLVCNATDDYKNNHITYNYTNEQIDSNLDYFERCMNDQLSEYKSLLFFSYYLTSEEYLRDKKINELLK